MLNKYCLLAVCMLLSLSSCNQSDVFTGVWNKDFNPTFDNKAFPAWKKHRSDLADTDLVKTPFFIRIKKEMGSYVLNCFQLDGATGSIVTDASVVDFVKFNKIDEYTLVSDNRISNMVTSRQITIHIDGQTRILKMTFPLDKSEMPADKKIRALFETMFSSGFRKIIEVRRKTNEARLIEEKLKNSNVIKSR
jgi:hypothetical protein